MPKAGKKIRGSWLLASAYRRLLFVLPVIVLMWVLCFWALR